MLSRILPVLFLTALALPLAGPATAGETAEKIEIQPFQARPDKATLEARIAANTSPRDLALAWHGLAGMQVEGASFKAVDLIEALPEIDTDPLLQAYLGSAFVMRARDQSFIGARIGSVRQGLKWLDRAGDARPADFEIHAIRAATTMNLPDIFDYRQTVRSDLDLILGQVTGGGAPIKAGSVGEGRIVASLAKICILQQDRPCAETQIAALESRHAGNSELSETARALRAALGN